MSSSGLKKNEGIAAMGSSDQIKDLTPKGLSGEGVDLRDMGFVGAVSQEALDEIDMHESCANRVLRTAANFAFR